MSSTRYSYTILMKSEVSRRVFFQNLQKPNFMKIRQVGAELFHVDRRKGRHDEGNSRFSQFCERVLTRVFIPQHYTINFCAKKLKFICRILQQIYSFSAVSTEGTGQPGLTTGDRRPEDPAELHVFLLPR